MSNEERIYRVCGCVINLIDQFPDYTMELDEIKRVLISIREDIDNQSGGWR